MCRLVFESRKYNREGAKEREDQREATPGKLSLKILGFREFVGVQRGSRG
jgi:hypothetical protein